MWTSSKFSSHVTVKVHISSLFFYFQKHFLWHLHAQRCQALQFLCTQIAHLYERQSPVSFSLSAAEKRCVQIARIKSVGSHEEKEQEILGPVCRKDCKNIIYHCVKLLNFMFIELMLAHVVTLALAVKIELASNAAVLLNRNRSFIWVILQPPNHT